LLTAGTVFPCFSHRNVQQLVPAAEGRDGTSDDAAATATPPALGGLRGIASHGIDGIHIGRIPKRRAGAWNSKIISRRSILDLIFKNS
jgi:hypothetical protein